MRKTMCALILCGLLSSLAPGQQEKETAEQRFSQLQKEWREYQKAYFEKQRAELEAAAEKGEAMPAVSMRAPTGEFIAKAIACARDHAGSDGAVPFLIFTIQMGIGDKEQEDSVAKAVDTLMTTHVTSAKIENLPAVLNWLGQSIGRDTARAKIALIEKKNPHPAVRARAIMALEGDALKSQPLDSAEYRKARSEFQRAKAMLVDDAELAATIQGMIDEREKLAVGQTAPDIAGVDLDGQAFKLSDYKGKVILLDFWGDW